MRRHIRKTWDITVEIPIYEIAQFLTETEYEHLGGITNDDVKVKLSFDYSPADKEVGIMSDSMEYNGTWGWDGKEQCKTLADAVSEFLESTDVTARLGEKAYDSYCDYCDYMRQGNIIP